MSPSLPYRPHHMPNNKFSPSSHPQSSPAMHHQQQQQQQPQVSAAFMIPQDIPAPQKKSRMLVLDPGPSPNASAHTYSNQISLVPPSSSSSSHAPMFTIPSQPQQPVPISQQPVPIFMEQQHPPAHPYPNKPDVDDELQDQLQRFLDSPTADGNDVGIVDSPGNEPFGTAPGDEYLEGSWAELASDGCITQCWTQFDGTDLTGEPMQRVRSELAHLSSIIFSYAEVRSTTHVLCQYQRQGSYGMNRRV